MNEWGKFVLAFSLYGAMRWELSREQSQHAIDSLVFVKRVQPMFQTCAPRFLLDMEERDTQGLPCAKSHLTSLTIQSVVSQPLKLSVETMRKVDEDEMKAFI